MGKSKEVPTRLISILARGALSLICWLVSFPFHRGYRFLLRFFLRVIIRVH